jgi:predicted extracellular nuclease/small nuclear ribonucleoprotein (snRNP)-like protein
MKKSDIKNKQVLINQPPIKQLITNTVTLNSTKIERKSVESSLEVEKKKKAFEDQALTLPKAESQPSENTESNTDVTTASENTQLAQAAGAVGDAKTPRTVPQEVVAKSDTAPGASSFSPAVLGGLGIIGVAALSSNGGSSSPAPSEAPQTMPLAGEVIDGYISGATVFIDENANGLLDTNEISTTSDALGAFTLPGDRMGSLVSIGGTDISTGLIFEGVLKAPAGSAVITPLTTLIELLQSNDAALTVSQAQAQVLASLGIVVESQTLNLLTFDPVQSSTEGAPGSAQQTLALEVQKAGVLVATLVSNISAAAAQAAGGDADPIAISSGVFELLSANLVAGALTPENIGNAVDTVNAAIAGNPDTVGIELAGETLTAFNNLATNTSRELVALANQLEMADNLDDIADLQKEILTDDNTFTLQLLHFADAEAGLLASQTASRMAALVDRFDDQYANTLVLAGGDNFLPGPFLAAGTDPSVISALNQVTGSTLAPNATVPIAAADIAIHNIIGVQASTIGNHEFDLGSRVLNDAIAPTATYKGALFPYLSSNLDFSADSDIRGRFTNTTMQAGLEQANTLNGRIAPSAVIEQAGEKIGLVGATTQLLNSISSPSGTTVVGSTVDNMDLLAAQLQPVIDDLRNQGVNKIILMAHLQNLNNERLLATKLKGVDIILAAGSNTRLGDADDVAVEFPGHAANFSDTYPVVIKDADNNDTLLVNTDNEFTYLGRLVVDFDAQGNILLDSVAENASINGAYASTDANVATAYGDDIAQAYAEGSKGGDVKLLTDAVQNVIASKDGNVYGFSNVYLEGERANVRSEETNLGNLTADANAYALALALGTQSDSTYIVSLKNGGGIRAQIGTLSAPKADGTVDKLPPDGGVSQLDVENSLRFNNQLMAFDTTAEGLKAILEHGVAAGTLQGRFPQLGGISFSWDATNPDGSAIPAGSRVKDIALVGDGYRVNLYDDGVLLANVPAKITVSTLSFLANGGDGYPIKANGENFRYITENPDGSVALSASVDETLNFTVATSVPNSAAVLAEQKALELFLEEFHNTPEKAFNQADTPASLDTRIQNLDRREEDVLENTPNPVLISAIQGEGDSSSFVDQVVKVRAQITAWLPQQNTFYIQEEVRDHDGNVNTSEGIAVFYTGTSPITANSIGDIVEFTGTVKEFFGLTRLESISALTVIEDGTVEDLQAYTQVKLPIASGATLEKYEGMLVEVSSATEGQALFAGDTFGFARFGEITFFADSVPFQFSQINAPDVEGNAAYLDFLNRNSIQLEDGFNNQNPTLTQLNLGTRILRDVTADGVDNGTPLGSDAQGNVNFIRMGDSTPTLNGVLGFGFGSYELIATEAVKLSADVRPAMPDVDAINATGTAEVRIASFNVLNYFTTLGNATFTTPDGTIQQGRGATNMTEFLQQQAKIVEAMLGTGAHVFGLNEIQNNGFGTDSAIVSLVNALNAKVGSDRFAFVQPDKTGSDAIMVAVVYDKTVLTAYGDTATPDTVAFDAFADSNRLPIAQTFAYNSDATKQFTVVVNHLKSKGGTGTGLDADQGDGQGQFNATRLEAAQQLAQWIETNPTGATDGDYLLIGDLNSYAQEDPIKALEEAGFAKVAADTDHSYVFDGLRGSLDHALSKGLGMEITGYDIWNINSDEQIALDYNDDFTPDDIDALDRNDAFRSSDHDPVIVGLKLLSEDGTPAMVTPPPAGDMPVDPTPDPETPPMLPNVFISEIHYDNTGTDVGEAIGIQGAAGTDLTGWSIVAYNGNGGASYGTVNLSGIIDDESNGQGELSFNFAGLQNGSPDGLALVDNNGSVVQFLSYEGAFAAVGGPANGMMSVDIGVAQAGTEPVGSSLQFNPAEGSWMATTTSNFGALNFINSTMENTATV